MCTPAAETCTFYAPNVVELQVYSLSNNTYILHTQMKSKPFLCLLNEENENVKHRIPPNGCHMKTKRADDFAVTQVLCFPCSTRKLAIT